MAKYGSGAYRIKTKMVSLDLLRGIKQTSILLDTTPEKLKKGHNDKTLPFPFVLIDNTYIFYIPIWTLRTITKVQELGVIKVLSFLKHLVKNKLERFMMHDFDWEKYDLTEWKKD